MVALNTFDVTVDYINDQAPFNLINTNTKLNTTKAQVIVDQAIGRVNGVLNAIGFTPADITEGTYPIAFENCQRIIAAVAIPKMMVPLQAQTNIELYTALKRDAKETLKELIENPRLALGEDLPSSDISPQVESVTADYGLTGTGTNARPNNSTSPYNTSRWDFDPTRKGNW